MKPLSFIFSALLVFSIFTALSCNKQHKAGNNTACANIMCTDLFAMITVAVVDSNSNAVQLTGLYTVRSGTGEVIRPNQATINGRYDVLDDSYMSHLRNDSDTFIFTAIRGADTARATFIIGGDCCHVRKISGPGIISIP